MSPDLDAAAAARHFDLGMALIGEGRNREAMAPLREAIRLRPDFAAALTNYGSLLVQDGRLAEGADSIRAALAFQPDIAEAHYHLGCTLGLMGQWQEGLSHFRRARELRPDHQGILLAAVGHLSRMNRFDDALADLRLADPETQASAEWLSLQVYCQQQSCDWEGLGQAVAGLCATLGSGMVEPYSLLAAPVNAGIHLRAAREWSARQPKPPVLPPPDPRARTKIRLGYLSRHFRNDPATLLSAGLFETHDRARFETIGYSLGQDDGSVLRRRVETAFDRFIDLHGAGDADVAQRIRDDGIDILVYMEGCFPGTWPAIPAARPAPVQVNFLVWPGTMGSDDLDYIIADPVVIPPGAERWYSEKVVRLPHCYQSNDRKRAASPATPSRAECSLPETGFVFCCFNQPFKITPALFDVWMAILRSVPDSVLWLYHSNRFAEPNLRREAAARDVDPARLVFAGHMPVPEHLARYRLADLFLDNWGYNAHTTASDALWMGVPVVTLIGETFMSRVGASLLNAVGLPELVTAMPEAYVAMALQLASDPEALAEIRSRLGANRLTAPLFDIERYARSLERAYIHMVETWDAGQAPQGFSVVD